MSLRSVTTRLTYAALTLAATGACAQQIAKLTPPDGAPYDYFGIGVSVSDGTAVIGAPGDDDAGEDSGSTYVYKDSGGTWELVAKLVADDGHPGDSFGYRVAVSGDTALVGAHLDDDGGESSGSVYVFRDFGGVWKQFSKLLADDASPGDRFGVSVAISADTALVAPWDAADGAAVYVFKDIAGVWRQVAKLPLDDAGQGSEFGIHVALSGTTAAITSRYDDDAGEDCGALYIFRDVGGAWQRLSKITSDDAEPGDKLGSVSISGNTVVVGVRDDDDAGLSSGSAYVFREIGGAWRQVVKLTSDNAAPNDRFGVDVSVKGGTVIVGADLDFVGPLRRGACYVFNETAGLWQQVERLTASDGAGYDYFGAGVSVGGETALIAASYNDEWGSQSGSAYLFHIEQPCTADFNGDGAVNTLDVLAFLNAWAGHDDSADFNADGAVNTLDVLAFLNAWAADC